MGSDLHDRVRRRFGDAALPSAAVSDIGLGPFRCEHIVEWGCSAILKRPEAA